MVIVDGAWTDALVLKARALAQLKRVSEAMSALNQAMVLSPAYPPVWIEMGAIYQDQKDWENSFKAYKNAENYAGAIEDKTKQTQVLASALRGQAVAMIELGRLDDAETLYKRCLKIEPGRYRGDRRAGAGPGAPGHERARCRSRRAGGTGRDPATRRAELTLASRVSGCRCR